VEREMKANLIMKCKSLPVSVIALLALTSFSPLLAQDIPDMQGVLGHLSLQQVLRDALRLAAWLAPLALVFIPMEHFFAQRKGSFKNDAVLQNLSFYFINGLVPGLFLAVPLALVAYGSSLALPEHVPKSLAGWPVWMRVAIGLVVNEIGTYWGHRMMHSIPFLWRFHSIHHSPERLYFLTSTFAHPIDKIVLRVCGLAPVYLFGIASPFTPDGRAVSAMLLLVVYLWGFFIHSNLKWRFGPLEWIVATPGFHHWHHTKTDHRDRNFSPMLPAVDWMFGTFYLPERQWPAKYGIEEAMPSTLGGRLLHPFRELALFNSLARRPHIG
jgi:sterol desaturase/sphingolipid hydroxylase (fatty acid hydroxylase superfamily)